MAHETLSSPDKNVFRGRDLAQELGAVPRSLQKRRDATKVEVDARVESVSTQMDDASLRRFAEEIDRQSAIIAEAQSRVQPEGKLAPGDATLVQNAALQKLQAQSELQAMGIPEDEEIEETHKLIDNPAYGAEPDVQPDHAP